MGTIHFSSTDPQAELPDDYTFSLGNRGFESDFEPTFKTAGPQTLTVTDTTYTSFTGATSLTIFGGDTVAVHITQLQPTGVAGAMNVTVESQDAYGNWGTGGSFGFSSSDPKAILPADFAFHLTDYGIHHCTVTFETAGVQSLTVSDGWNSITDTKYTTVLAGGLAELLVSATTPVTAGVADPVTVSAADQYGNTIPDYIGTVHFSSTDSKAVLPTDYTFAASDNGSHIFTATFKTAGTRSITATDTVTASITGTQSGIIVKPGRAKTLSVTTTTSWAAGGSHSVYVTAEDAYGNTATGYIGTIHFTSTDAQALLPADYTFTSGDKGVHTFSVTLKTAGTQAVRARDTIVSTITGVQNGIVVNPGTAKTLVVSGLGSPRTAGVAGTITVAAKDAYGNTATGYTGTVTFTSTDTKAVLPANYKFISGDKGVHTFSVTLKTAGTDSVRARDTVTSTITGGQYPITVTPAAAATLVVSGLTTPRTAGTAGTITVKAVDAFGNTATGYLGTVHFTSTDAKAILPADYTFTAANAGVRTFSVTLKTAGTQVIRARDTVTSTITGTQGGIVVS